VRLEADLAVSAGARPGRRKRPMDVSPALNVCLRANAHPVAAWRPTRTASGNFEGVLGFGGAAASPVANTAAVGTPVEANGGPQSPWKEKTEQPKEKPAETFGSGGGPGWGTGQKKWRLAAGRTAGDNDAVSSCLHGHLRLSTNV